jgi:hypothetical protein
MAKQKQEYENVRVSITNGDFKKLKKLSDVRKVSLIEAVSLLINHQCNDKV